MLGALVALAVPAAAHAQSCTAGASAIAFGSYNPRAALPTDATGTVTVQCAAAPIALMVNYTVALSAGNAGSFTTRHMSTGGRTLNYQLYADALRTAVWGDGGGSSGTVDSTILLAVLNISSRTHAIFGRMPAGQTSAVSGSYADTITVTVSY